MEQRDIMTERGGQRDTHTHTHTRRGRERGDRERARDRVRGTEREREKDREGGGGGGGTDRRTEREREAGDKEREGERELCRSVVLCRVLVCFMKDLSSAETRQRGNGYIQRIHTVASRFLGSAAATIFKP